MIEIEGLTKAFGATTAVDDVSLTVERGRVAALVGTSGSGKTTLLRMINRLVEPTAGRVLVDGADTRSIPAPLLRRRMGYVIQGHGLFPHRTVAQNIATVPRLLGWPRAQIAARVDELLALFQLDPAAYRDRMPHELSGGQQQRVGVARALAARPDVLLMDEPFGALDPVIRAQAREDLRALQRRLGTTLVIVTHDMEEAIALGDRIAVMDAGRLLQYAPPARIMRHPATPFVEALVGSDERPFRLLSLGRVAEVAEPGSAPGNPVARDAPLRAALAESLWSGRAVLPVEGGGVVRREAIEAWAGMNAGSGAAAAALAAGGQPPCDPGKA
ncbi:ABC transporter ATP-binding protein [Paracoccus yeei]|uniref:ABC transporter ATP-binding protein n=1 Tax=Paracoccus yeei TaxID=147645 RepID=A0A1V0GXJ8_9RHOB|nr:ABC transporter ATP-binding protein [Paracoccus yeei]ARC38520.1 ABC transporter ATP-binding protein [Paracoccus yeei]